MTLATMADHSLPLAERVVRLVNVGSTLSGAEYAAALDALRADIAAADRLARACSAWIDATDDPTVRLIDVEPKEAAMDTAHIAYRARMQGVARG